MHCLISRVLDALSGLFLGLIKNFQDRFAFEVANLIERKMLQLPEVVPDLFCIQ